MSMDDIERPPPPRGGAPAGEDMADLVQRVARTLGTSLVIAGAAIALAIYSRPAPQRYEAFEADGRIVRVDTRSGTVLACERGKCFTIVKRGQRLVKNPDLAAPPKQAALPPPAPQAPAKR